jgi:hypothetical protein
MKFKITSFRKFSTSLALMAVAVVVGCGGVSSNEMSALEAQTRSTEAAEQKVVELRAKKAAKEAEVAEKSANKSALQDRLAATKFNLDN